MRRCRGSSAARGALLILLQELQLFRRDPRSVLRMLPEIRPRRLTRVGWTRSSLRPWAALRIRRPLRIRSALRMGSPWNVGGPLGMGCSLRVRPTRPLAIARLSGTLRTARRRSTARPGLRGRLAGRRPAPGAGRGGFLLAAADRRASIRTIRAERARGRHTGRIVVRLRGSARGTSGRLHTKTRIIAWGPGLGTKWSRVSRIGVRCLSPFRDGRFRPGTSVRGRSAVFRPRVPARGPALPS